MLSLSFSNRKKIFYIIWGCFTYVALMSSIGYFNGRTDYVISKLPAKILDIAFFNLHDINMVLGGDFTAAGGIAHISLGVEVSANQKQLIESYAPKITDRMQMYFNSLTESQLRKTPSLEWLRKELIFEANKVSGPVTIHNVTFREVVFN